MTGSPEVPDLQDAIGTLRDAIEFADEPEFEAAATALSFVEQEMEIGANRNATLEARVEELRRYSETCDEDRRAYIAQSEALRARLAEAEQAQWGLQLVVDATKNTVEQRDVAQQRATRYEEALRRWCVAYEGHRIDLTLRAVYEETRAALSPDTEATS